MNYDCEEEDNYIEELASVAFEFASTSTEQDVEFLTAWNGYYVFEFVSVNLWGSRKNIMERFVLVQNNVARFATEEEFLALTELVENQKSLSR